MTATSVDDRYYSVFVSATYLDLIKERQEVISVLLKHGQAIPIGMEQFSAGSRPPWEVIKAAINRCDYYLLIIKNRYGSIVPARLQAELGSISYTEAEYDYAQSLGLPTLVFVHSDPSSTPASLSAQTATERVALAKFRSKVEADVTLDRYSSPADLGAVVALAWTKLLSTQPARGWVRGVEPTSPGAIRPSLAPEMKDVLDRWQTQRERSLRIRLRFAARAKDVANPDGSDVEAREELTTAVTITWGTIFELVASSLGHQRIDRQTAVFGLSDHIGDHPEEYVDPVFLESLHQSEDRLRHRAAALRTQTSSPLPDAVEAVQIMRFCYSEGDGQVADGLRKFGMLSERDGLWELSDAGRRVYETERYSMHDDDR